ncbi:MAG: HAD-IA family hydrolase [Planctomycetes bacterium]|nr:HAD-IA family hydrolase [Planctomycetota bacterium]
MSLDPSIRGLLFDAGYTLLRAVPSVGAIYRRITRTFGVDIPAAAFDRAAWEVFDACHREWSRDPAWHRTSEEEDRATWRAILEALHRHLGRPPLPVEAWFDTLYETFRKPDVWALYDDVADALDRLAAHGMALGVVSNWNGSLRGILEHHGIAPRLRCIVMSAVEGIRKPHPAIFERGVEALGLAANEVAYIGDTYETDIEGAERAGLRGILIRRGDPERDGKPPVPCATIRSLRDLL